jgi:flagellar biosynthesis protein FliR
MLNALILGYAATFTLMVSRITGFVVGSPFPGDHVSATQRVGLVAGLAWVATMFAPMSSIPREIGPRLAAASILELGCGLVIGLAFRFIMTAAEVAGQVLAHAVGLSSPSVLNPTLDAQDSILSRIVTLLAMLLALAAGVHRVALQYLLASFSALPLGTPMSLTRAATGLIDLAIGSFAVGIQLAMPVIGVAFVVQLGLAMIARAAPALQIFSVGLSVMIATGFVVLSASLRDIGSGLLVHFASLSGWLDVLLLGMSERAP